MSLPSESDINMLREFTGLGSRDALIAFLRVSHVTIAKHHVSARRFAVDFLSCSTLYQTLVILRYSTISPRYFVATAALNSI